MQNRQVAVLGGNQKAPTASMDFAAAGTSGSGLDPRFTFARASAASYVDGAGVLQRVEADIPRLSPSGLLMEETRTNYVRNPRGLNAAAPLTPPTYWTMTQPGSGISNNVVGTGVINGVWYCDFEVFGTSSAPIVVSTGLVSFEGNTAPAVTGQSWTLSGYFQITAGTLPALSLTMDIAERTSVGALTATHIVQLAPTGTLARYTTTALLTGGATTAFVQPLLRWGIGSGVTLDFTLRCGLPQLELGAFITSPIF